MELTIVNQPRVFPRRKTYRYVKRLVDLTLCLLSFPVTLPIMAICALAIFIDDPNCSIFYNVERAGRGGRLFRMYKFRTMKSGVDNSPGRLYMKAYVKGEIGDDEADEKCYKGILSNQITCVGRILRKTSLDELPQLINVFKRDMSIVGPRPNVLWEVDAYQPWHYERMEVLPGITGLAQVRGRSSIGFNSLVRHDIEYVENQSLSLDLKILWWTATALLHGKGVM